MRARWIRLMPLLAVFILCLCWIGSELGLPLPSNRTGPLRAVIAAADEIRIRNGGFDCGGPVDDQEVLRRITDPAAIRAVRENLEFGMFPGLNCKCCGYPGIDWYRDGRRIALTSVQHGKRLRWNGWTSDSVFTRHTREWLTAWFKKLDINYPDPYPEMDETKRDNLAEYIEPLIDEPYVALGSLEVTDYTPLSRLQKVRALVLDRSKITDLSPLTKLITLRELSLHGAPVTDISPLAKLQGLESLDLTFTPVTDLAALESLPGLEHLKIHYDPAMDLSPLFKLKKLTWLEVWGAEEQGADVKKLRRELRAKLPGCEIHVIR